MSIVVMMQNLSEEEPEVRALEYAYFMTGGSPRGLRLHRRDLTAGQPDAEFMNEVLDEYKYTIDSDTDSEGDAESDSEGDAESDLESDSAQSLYM